MQLIHISYELNQDGYQMWQKPDFAYLNKLQGKQACPPDLNRNNI